MTFEPTTTNEFLCLEQIRDYAEQNEITLVRSAQSGDVDSFNALVLKYQDVMYRTVLRILGQEVLAEDATQDALISAFQHIGQFRGSSLKAWFIRILVNKCYDGFRHMQRTPAISLDESLMSDGENEGLYTMLWDQAPSAEEYVEASEQTEYIQKCLSKLPADYRVVLVLVDVEEMSYVEASAILKIPLGTVKSRLARARLYMRRELEAGGAF